MEKLNIVALGELALLLEPFESKIKLILHVGTPKTGTTSVQTYLDKKQRKLRGRGVLYPHSLEKSQNPSAPKHQWFEKNLCASHLTYFVENFKNIISQVTDETHTIILSSEGIYNYWWDFSAHSKGVLAELGELFDIEVWVWFREPLAFIESYYKQCMRNPQVSNNPCYGKKLSFSEMLDINWFSQHLDYLGFTHECQELFGHNKVLTFRYEGDTVQNVIKKLGLETPHDTPTPRQNESVNNAAIALWRTINGYNLKAKDKELLVPHLKKMNDILGRYDNEVVIDKDSREKVLALSSSPIVF